MHSLRLLSPAFLKAMDVSEYFENTDAFLDSLVVAENFLN